MTEYKTIIRTSIVLRGKACTLLEKGETKLFIFERKFLRKIFWAIKDKDEWRLRYIQELDQPIKEGNVMLYQSAPAKRARPCNENGEQESAEKNCRGHSIPHYSKGRPRSIWIDDL